MAFALATEPFSLIDSERHRGCPNGLVPTAEPGERPENMPNALSWNDRCAYFDVSEMFTISIITCMPKQMKMSGALSKTITDPLLKNQNLENNHWKDGIFKYS